MPQKIPTWTGTGEQKKAGWGQLSPHSKVKMPPRSAEVLGACLDFTVEALESIELQILWLQNVKLPRHTKDILWIYFGVTEVQSISKKGYSVLLDILSVLRTVRTGMEDERGKIDIRQNDPKYGGYKGYVTYSLFSGRGPVHMDFKNIMSGDLIKGAAYFMNLYVHEATHRYAATIDVPVGPSKTLAYLSTSTATNILTAYEQARLTRSANDARQSIVGGEGMLLTTEEALNNADSFSWFVQAMIQDYARSLDVAMKLKQRPLAETADNFATQQLAAMLEVFDGMDVSTIKQMAERFEVT